MKYVRIDTETQEIIEFPFLLSTLKLAFPNVSFQPNMSEEDLQALGIFSVTETENTYGRPDGLPYDPYEENIKQAETPTLIDGQWTLTWGKTDKTDEEKAEFLEERKLSFRGARDGKLTETDVEVLRHIENGEAIPEALKEYRQALRDLPADADFGKTSTPWPTYNGIVIQHD